MRSVSKAAYIVASALGVLVVAWLAFNQSQVGVSQVPGAVRPAAANASGTVVTQGVDAEFDAGMAAFDAGRLEEALPRFQAVPAESAVYALARNQIGVIQSRQGNLEAAGQTFAELTDLVPEMVEPWKRLALVRFAEGRYDDAEGALLRVVELDPTDVNARYELGLVRLAQGRTNEAVGAYVRAMKAPLPPEQQRLFALDAIERVERFRAGHPDVADVHYVLAFFANSIGRRDLEIEELEQFLAATPDGPLVERAREQLRAARERGTAPAPAR
jgi:tetratricopeptide (TPR) repeat protein